jgi:uncharacterized Zn finger protein
MYDYYGWKPYVPVAARRKQAEREAAKHAKKGEPLSPVVVPSRGSIVKTFWGKAWCDNLEHYSDYANRLPRGRSYVRNGSVIDLKIAAGEVSARVVGSSLYQVRVKVSAVPGPQWQTIGRDCANSIDSLVELLQGRLSKSVMERICRLRTGLFPAPAELQPSCSCPDWAGMCKHVAAALYGVGARLDSQPELLFTLRGVDPKDLVARAGSGLSRSGKRPSASKVLDDMSLADVFGIEMAQAESPPPAQPLAAMRAKVPASRKGAAKKAPAEKTPAARKAPAAKKMTAAKKAPAVKKPPAAKEVSGVKKMVSRAAVARKPAAARKSPATKKR